MAQSPFFTAKFTKAFIAWWMVWFAMQAVILYWGGFSWRVSITDSAVFNILTALGCRMIAFMFQYYLPGQERFWYILALSVALSLCIVFIGKWILITLLKNDITYIAMLQNWLPIRFGIALLMLGCMAMISVVWYGFIDQQEAEERRAVAEALKKETELIALRRQLQPHFLFNSLNSISAMVGTMPGEARKMIQQLSDFLRSTIHKEDDRFVLLSEELTHLQLYLDIEKVRFGHRLIATINADELALQQKMPALILQPLVENAIKFGLYDTTDAVTITITGMAENNHLLLKVSNPFDPQTAMPQKGEGFGLNSVKRRLYLLFARNDLVETSMTDNIFTTTVIIPQ